MRICIVCAEIDSVFVSRFIRSLTSENHRVSTIKISGGDPVANLNAFRSQLRASDFCVFFLTSMANTEETLMGALLDMVRDRWKSPKSHILPVILENDPAPNALLERFAVYEAFWPDSNVVAQLLSEIAKRYDERPDKNARRPYYVVSGLVATLLAVLVGVMLALQPPSQLPPGAASFQVVDGEDIISWGGSINFSLENQKPNLVSDYFCKVAKSDSPNISTVDHKPDCSSITVTAKNAPFVDKSDVPYKMGHLNPQVDSILITVFDNQGRIIWTKTQMINLMQPFEFKLSMAKPSGAAAIDGQRLPYGETVQARLKLNGHDMPASMECIPSRDSNSINIRIEHLGSCDFNIMVRGKGNVSFTLNDIASSFSHEASMEVTPIEREGTANAGSASEYFSCLLEHIDSGIAQNRDLRDTTAAALRKELGAVQPRDAVDPATLGITQAQFFKISAAEAAFSVFKSRQQGCAERANLSIEDVPISQEQIESLLYFAVGNEASLYLLALALDELNPNSANHKRRSGYRGGIELLRKAMAWEPETPVERECFDIKKGLLNRMLDYEFDTASSDAARSLQLYCYFSIQNRERRKRGV